MAKKSQMKKRLKLAHQARVDSETASPVESALERALELSQNDGSIVLSAGSMFVTAEVMKAWNKNESSQRVE